MNEVEYQIIDVREQTNFRDYLNTPVKKPFVILVRIQNLLFDAMSEEDRFYTASFATNAEAKKYLKTHEIDTSNKVFLVTCNVSGMGVTKIFKSFWNAYLFVTSQEGEWTSDLIVQDHYFGININGGAYAHVSYGRFDIKMVELED